MNKLIEGFDRLLPNLVIDKRFLKLNLTFNLQWANKNHDYVEFLGGNTIGVQAVRFSNIDDELWCDMIGIDINKVILLLRSLPEIDTKRQVASNPMYMTMMYLIHKTMKTDKLNQKDKKDCIIEIYKTFSYKVISGRMAHFFKFTVDPDVARSVSEKLSNKFLLKKLGSWNNFIAHRALDILPGGLHYNNLNTMNINKIQYVIADLFLRYKDVFKSIYPILLETIEQNNSIKSESKLEKNSNEGDLELQYRDSNVNATQYSNYLNSILYNPNDLILPELVILVLKPYRGNVSRELLLSLLKNLNQIDPKQLVYILDGLLPTVLDFLYRKKLTNNYKKHLYNIINMVRGFTLANTVKDQFVVLAKDEFTTYVRNVMKEEEIKGYKAKANNIIRMGVSSLIVYLCARALYKN